MNFLSKALTLGNFRQATVSYPPNMTNNTTPSPYIASANVNDVNAFLAFDSSLATGWSQGTEFTAGDWLRIYLGAAKSITSYTITSTQDGANNKACPASFNLQGSNDGNAWTLVDAQTGVVWADGQSTKTFTLGVPSVAYAYFRIELLASSIPGNP